MPNTPNFALISFRGRSICTGLWAFKKGFSIPGLPDQRRIISYDFKIHQLNVHSSRDKKNCKEDLHGVYE